MTMNITTSFRATGYLLPLLLMASSLLFFGLAKGDQQCSIDFGVDGTTTSDSTRIVDPNLKEMTYDVGDGPQKFMAYVEPDVTTFYTKGGQEPPASTRVTPKFNGLAGKFINMSNKYLTFWWESRENDPNPTTMRHYTPFSSGGSGTFPGHRFFFTPSDDPTARLNLFIVQDYPENVYVYDPYFVEGDPKQTEINLKKALNRKERETYDEWKKTLSFNEQYRNFTGRSYLANYLRKPPNHFMWPADYFGQQHWITTKETHFAHVPPIEELDPIVTRGEKRQLKDTDPRILSEYRVQDTPVMNMTLTVLSVAPRVFEIQNFLSDAEVQHIVKLASGIDLRASTVGDVGSNKVGSKRTENNLKTRTSFNSWVPREQSPIIDAIYRRAADLLRIDETLLRHRGRTEYPELPSTKPVCESLQLVHYGLTQEYTAHHDFGYSAIDDQHNAARYATLLFYLNGGNGEMVGGETEFPRWVNAETFEGLKVKPEPGKAVLFYSQLPDGNMDDFSQHAALPIKDGEKWLINLWVWDPIYD